MAKKMKHWGLLNHFNRWGIKWEESDGWRHRGRPYNFYPRAILVHHTASRAGSGNFASYYVVRDGRSGLPGPLCQFLLGRDGTVRVIAAGYANHAGYGGPSEGLPANRGNTFAIGIEAENNGVGEPWSRAQLNAYYRLCAALMVWIGRKDVDRVIGHKEWTSRKIDPAGINMNYFRRQVKKAMDQGPTVQTVSLRRLKPGKRNKDILRVKRRLHRRGFRHAKKESNYFGAGFRHDYQDWQKHLGFTGGDADGIPGRTSLQRLGFRVVD